MSPQASPFATDVLFERYARKIEGVSRPTAFPATRDTFNVTRPRQITSVVWTATFLLLQPNQFFKLLIKI